VPLLFASDGQVFLRQNLRANTLPEKITAFPTPAEFGEFFQPQATELNGTLRDYQRVAVSQVLGGVQAGRRRMYLQMATGTGKTITAAGVIAKLWSVRLLRRALFLVDRDALAMQTVRKFKTHLGDNFDIDRATGGPEDRHRDILVTTVQHLAVRGKYRSYPPDHFSLVVLDECHRTYFGDWYGVLDHFAQGGAILLGLTATPADKETVNTDRFFTDPGQYRGPIYRYTIREGETNPEVPEWERLAACIHHKFHTNVDLEGVHDMGFDYEPEQLGRAVDVPQRNELIAEKYFEILGKPGLPHPRQDRRFDGLDRACRPLGQVDGRGLGPVGPQHLKLGAVGVPAVRDGLRFDPVVPAGADAPYRLDPCQFRRFQPSGFHGLLAPFDVDCFHVLLLRVRS
jgi:type I restriction enzyme R subunit